MKFSVAAALIALTSAVSAQFSIVSITSPLTGTVYHAGSDAIISWVQPTVSTISKITLVKGNPNALQPVLTVAQDVDANAGSYTWAVPSTLAGGADYALELGTSPNISYTGLFTIENDGTTNASTVATAISSGANASASSASSASASASASA